MSSEEDTESSRESRTEREVVAQRVYDPASGPDLTSVVIMTIADAEGVPATEIRDPPLYDVVDIAAVKDALFGSTATGSRGMAGGTLEFPYRGYRVTVRGDGWVQVADPSHL